MQMEIVRADEVNRNKEKKGYQNIKLYSRAVKISAHHMQAK